MAADFGPLVSADWLAAHLDEVAVVDVRWYLDGRSGWDAYRAGHIPGAVWLDVDTDLSAPASPAAGRHPLPTEAAFAAALARMGIAEGRPVVAYDDAGGSVAARLWWMLRAIGEPAAVLDGGLAAWTDHAGELSTDVPTPLLTERAPRPWPSDRFLTADELAASSALVFDARSAERYAHALGAARAKDSTALSDAVANRVNAVLIQSERRLTDQRGLPRRPWYEHELYAPGLYTGYGVKTMPAVPEAIEQRDVDQASARFASWPMR